MALSEYGQVILHNYKLGYLIKFRLLCLVFSFCKSSEDPGFKLLRAAILYRNRIYYLNLLGR